MLRAGDAVALVAPAGPVTDAEITRACEAVRALGLVPRLGANAANRRGHLAGTDEERAADFNAAVRNSDIRAAFALRGGYGTMRLLDLVDYDALREDPKVVLGYSDLTALLNAITQQTGLVTFHGPVAALSDFTGEETRGLRAAIMSEQPLGELHAEGARSLTSGIASGRLAGGNLSLMAALAGTAHAIDTAGAIVLIEDVDEAPYRIDRMLTQLRMSGALHRAAGIMAGGLTNCDVPDDHVYAGMRLRGVLEDRLGDLGIPVLLDVPAGHVAEQWTLPIGAHATLDADARTLTVAQSAVCYASGVP